jgi:hypothetical protein
MKNIHLIPTDKPSKLYLNGFQRLVLDDKIEIVYDDYSKNQHIYITSEEEIKEGDYVFASGGFRFVKTLNKDRARTFKDDGIVSKQNPSSSCHLSNYKKIILTTDQDLINDGVQVIDDEFLEWFVKNPSCEEVEVVGDDCYYEIIIPLEEPKDVVLGSKTSLDAQMLDRFEPKQETLEGDLLDTAIQVVGSNNVTTIREFLVKHKSQQERMKQDFIYVATWDGIPVLGAPNRELLEQALNEYNNDTPIRYEAYNPKYPDDLEGWYYYKDPQTEGEECRFSVRCIEFKGGNK